MSQPLTKVCGLTDHPQNRLVTRISGITHVGFIFVPESPRFTHQTFPTNGLKRTGVFVNADPETILATMREHDLQAVQLHGNESPAVCRELKAHCEVIKAFGIGSKEDLEPVTSYHNSVDLLLFDTKTEQHGGSGRSFDWQLLTQYHGPTPFLLSGGIGLSSLIDLRRFQHPYFAGYDLNSRFETEPGIKNPQLIQQFIHELFHEYICSSRS